MDLSHTSLSLVVASLFASALARAQPAPDAGPAAAPAKPPPLVGIDVRPEDIQADAGRDAKRLAAKLNGAWDATSACVAKNPFAPMTATLMIDTKGHVTSATVTPRDPAQRPLADCVSAAFSPLVFDEAPAVQTVTVALARTGPKIVLKGSLDKEIIRRIVQEHSAQVRGCYEKELAASPKLAGKVVMKWIVGADGSVTEAHTESTDLKNANVEGCIEKTILTWTFPKPKGGGIVIVNYPFTFKQPA